MRGDLHAKGYGQGWSDGQGSEGLESTAINIMQDESCRGDEGFGYASHNNGDGEAAAEHGGAVCGGSEHGGRRQRPV